MATLGVVAATAAKENGKIEVIPTKAKLATSSDKVMQMTTMHTPHTS